MDTTLQMSHLMMCVRAEHRVYIARTYACSGNCGLEVGGTFIQQNE